MNVLLINGSPNKLGCTYTALKELAGALGESSIETEIFNIGKKPIQGCTACRKCREIGKCIFDDSANQLVEMIKGFDGFIIGSPVYYAGPNGSLLALLQRAFYSGVSSFAYKPGAAVVSARRGGTTATLDVLNKFFAFAQTPMVSSKYWNMVHGNTPDEVRKDLEGMQIMRTLGRNMAWLLQSIEEGRKAGVKLPAMEEKVATNFIR